MREERVGRARTRPGTFAAAFDEGQHPRDKQGRFGSGGPLNLDKDGYDESGKPGPAFAQKGGALWLYRGDGSDINDQLRSGDVTEPEVRDALDAAMRPLGKDSVLYRDSKLELTPGTEFVEQGYTSTAYKKGSFGPGAIKIEVPKTAPVLRVGD